MSTRQSVAVFGWTLFIENEKRSDAWGMDSMANGFQMDSIQICWLTESAAVSRSRLLLPYH